MLAENGYDGAPLNIGSGGDVSIRELAGIVADVVGFRGRWSSTTASPTASPQKLLDSARIAALGWRPTTRLVDGLRRTYAEAPFAA